MIVSQVGSRYCVETETGRLHILNEKSLRWNLKKVFGMTAKDVALTVKVLSEVGRVLINKEAV